jgi:CRP-like cAMP-binding protein
MTTSRRLAPQGVRKHVRSERMKELAAVALAQQVGYLRIEDLPGSAVFDKLPTRSFNAHRIIRGKNELFLVKHGLVEIWHTHYDKLVKTLEQGALFGEMPLVGQSMLGTRAITGTPGATVAVMDEAAALRWVEADPALMLRMVGKRLARVEDEHYRSRFQLTDSRIAALLLELAGDDSAVIGVTHEEMGEKIGVYRETVTNILDAMKMEKLVEVGRKRVTILDRRALRELSEL